MPSMNQTKALQIFEKEGQLFGKMCKEYDIPLDEKETFLGYIEQHEMGSELASELEDTTPLLTAALLAASTNKPFVEAFNKGFKVGFGK